MVRIRFLTIGIILALLLGVTGTVLAADVGPAADDIGPIPDLPTLKLTVEPSMLAIYPPYMVYTAQLSFVPPTSTAVLTADYYNVRGPALIYLGSARVDRTGKAVFTKQMPKGTYIGIARVVLSNQQVVWSPEVIYTVP